LARPIKKGLDYFPLDVNMNELIKVTQNENLEQVVSGRLLHEFLEISTRFDIWIERNISDFEFLVDQDFCTFLVESTGGRPRRKYLLKLDMAKELSMLARNEKGREARKYFISCEKKLHSIKKELSRMEILTLAMESEKEAQRLLLENSKQQKVIEKQAPKVEFYNDAMGSETLIDLNDVAKTLLIKKDGKILGRNLLYSDLRERGLLNDNNRPYQKYVNSGMFKLVERSYIQPKTGESILYFKTLLTQRGVTYLHKILLKDEN